MAVLYVKLAFATAVVLAPGLAASRGRSACAASSASLAWSLVGRVRGAGDHLRARLDADADARAARLVAVAAARAPPLPPLADAETVPARAWVLFWGAIVGVLLWVAAPSVQGDGLFHLARARKLLELDDLSLERVSEFADGSLHPGYAFPLWHGFIALIAKVAGEDPERVVTHLPSILAPLAVLVAFEAGWALFRRTWAAGVTAGGAGGDDRLRAGHGRRVRLPLPAGDVVAAAPRAGCTRAGARVRALAVPRARRLDRGCGIRARGRASDVRDLPLDPVRPGFLLVRALWEHADVRRARSRSGRS